jgi:hypothetical protein
MLTPIHIANVAVSWGLLTLIWLVQIIIYPGLARIPADDFVQHHAWYVTRMTMIVLPLMIAEIIIAIAWLFLEDSAFYPMVAGSLVIIVWWSTVTFQVPVHKRLQAGKDRSKLTRLAATNWIRTVAWTIKAVLVVVLAAGRWQ